MKFNKGKVAQLTIGCWTARGDCKISLSPLLDLSFHGVEEIKMEKVDCRGDRSSLNGVMSLFSILTLQSWTIDQLEMHYVKDPWRYLTNLAGQGTIKSLTVVGTGRAFSQSQDVKHWVKGDVEVTFQTFDQSNQGVSHLKTCFGERKTSRIFGTP